MALSRSGFEAGQAANLKSSAIKERLADRIFLASRRRGSGRAQARGASDTTSPSVAGKLVIGSRPEVQPGNRGQACEDKPERRLVLGSQRE